VNSPLYSDGVWRSLNEKFLAALTDLLQAESLLIGFVQKPSLLQLLVPAKMKNEYRWQVSNGHHYILTGLDPSWGCLQKKSRCIFKKTY
jgi:hypothetical protein